MPTGARLARASDRLLVLAGPAEAGVHHIKTAAQFEAVVKRIGNRAGTILLERGRYSTLQIGRRSTRALADRAAVNSAS